ncbi:MAG: hypothetical protein SFV22_01850 [Saprospiraceae bacterium]|nr:hypothetical protein [Saprospiraceae bacterium]
MKTSALFSAAFLAFVLLSACSGSPQIRFSYTNIKRLPNSNDFRATGYFSNDPVPMLVNDPKWLRVNTPMPVNSYLPLYGTSLDSFGLGTDSTRLYGAFVTVTGVADPEGKTFGRLRLVVKNVEVNSSSNTDRGPAAINHCNLPDHVENCFGQPNVPPLCDISTPSSRKFALLFSGGQNYYNAKRRYWNDLEFFYLTLRSQYGFSDENMVVLYMNGVKEIASSPMKVDHTASDSGLINAIAYLYSKMAPNDTLVIFVTNHGGGYDPGGTLGQSGALDYDSVSDEGLESPAIDEVIFYYKPSSKNSYITDDLWKTRWHSLFTDKTPKTLAIYEPCFSGGFLRDMAGNDRINIAATSQYYYSHSMPPYNEYDCFSHNFTAALYGRNADGSCLKDYPDYDRNGKISVWEAYRYANWANTTDDQPKLDDDDDENIVNGLILPTPPGAHSLFAKNFFLK